MDVIVMIALGLATAAFLLLPYAKRQSRTSYDWDGTHADRDRTARRAAVEAEVQRYRDALRAGTVCSRCAEANSPGSRFCAECGQALQEDPADASSVPD